MIIRAVISECSALSTGITSNPIMPCRLVLLAERIYDEHCLNGT